MDRTPNPKPAHNEPGPPARPRRRRFWSVRVVSIQIIVLWVAFVAPYAVWGLPSTDIDPLLFPDGKPWPAERYQAAARVAELRSREAGADTDLNPLAARDRIVELTATEAQRAEILTRYRLYSRQPDEMITFRALQQMDPSSGDFDPKLYQYGGLYIYMIGGALKLASLLGVVHLTGDVSHYLTHPDAFGRFYVVSRVVSILFGAAALLAASFIGRRAGGRCGAYGGILFLCATPTFLAGVLDAKPHMPSAAMILWAIAFALTYFQWGRTRDALIMGLFSGCAVAMVPTGAAAFALWPGLLWYCTPRHRKHVYDLSLALAVAAAVYVVTNPYVVWNVLSDGPAFWSNLNNSLAMYSMAELRPHPRVALYVARLVFETVGFGICLLGTLALLLQWRFPREVPLASLPGVVLGIVFFAYAWGKPAEFARFFLVPGMLLGIIGAGGMGKEFIHNPRRSLLMLLFCLWSMHTIGYVNAFAADAEGVNEARRLGGRFLAERMEPGDAVGVLQEPAPYCVPPMDFATRRVLWMPPVEPADLSPAALPTWLVFTADDDEVHAGDWWQAHYERAARFPDARTRRSRITWANKPTFVYRLKADAAGSTQPAATSIAPQGAPAVHP